MFASAGGPCAEPAASVRAGNRASRIRTPEPPASRVDGAPRVVVIGNGLWQRRFGSDPGVVGRSIRLDGESYEVVGVMPQGFAYPGNTELWMPAAFTEGDLTTQRGAHYLHAVGRLRPGMTLESADAETDAIMARLAAQYADANEGVGGAVRGLLGGIALSDTLTGLLFELSPTDPVTYVLVAAVLPATALLASWLPARRAARVDPMQALRQE